MLCFTQVYRGNESDPTAGACLRIYDMILSMNGKSLGGMTELGVAVELDVCGRELELVVARYRDSVGASQQLVTLERSEWKAFDDAVKDKRRLDWFEMNGNGSVRSSQSIEMLQGNHLMQFDFQGNSLRPLGSPQCNHSAPAQIYFQNPSRGSQQHLNSQLSQASPTSLASRRSGQSQKSRSRDARSDASGVWAEDDDAWLGCVCGEIHPEPIRVFWIQCDDCHSWYNVAPVCVGFNEFEASSIGNFYCRGCEDSVVVDQASVRSNRSISQVCLPRGSLGKRISAVPRSIPLSTVGTPASMDSKRTSSQLSATEILEDRKRRRTEDGCFLPLRTPKRKADGTYPRPCGRAPPGMVWDAIRGLYAPGSKAKGLKQSPSPESSTPPAKKVDDPRPQCDAKSTCERLSQTPDVCQAHTLTNGRQGHSTKSADLQERVSSERSKSGRTTVDDPRPQRDVTSTSESLTEMPIVSPADALTKTSSLSASQKSSSKPKKGSRLERELEREKRMTDDGCLRPNSALRPIADGTYPRPRGRGPRGMVWDAHRGVYAPPKLVAKSKPTLASNPTLDFPPKQSEATIPAIDADGREIKVTIKGIGSPEKPRPNLLPVGSLVSVEEIVWIGSNKAGGIGTVADYRNEGGTIT